MRQKRRDDIALIYRRNEKTKAYVIDISLDHYQELFDGWDASPFKRKALDPGLMEYLETCGYEVPLRYPLEMVFYVPEQLRDEYQEKMATDAIKNNFKVTLHFIRATQHSNHRKAFTYFIASISVLLMAFLIPPGQAIFVLFDLLEQVLFIGGWVLLWEAFIIFFFQGYEIRQRQKRYKRFLDSEILFLAKTPIKDNPSQ